MKNDRSTIRFFLLSAITLALVPYSARAEEDYIARAVSVSGKVLVRGEGAGSVQMTFLKPGDKLAKGTIINTSSNGAVKLLMTDRTILDLGPSSLFKMNDYKLGNVGDRQVDMSLDYGQVRASVNEKITSNKGKFTIRTKAATMGVRGTEFVVNAPIPVGATGAAAIEPPKTSLTVMHGKVEVADAMQPSKVVAVTPGFQFAKSGDTAGQVAQLPPQDVARIKSDAFQKDMTFTQTVVFDANTSAESNNRGKETASNQSGEGKGGSKDDPKGEPKGEAPRGGMQTLENIGMSVETQSKETPPPAITDLKLPGTFTPEVPQSRPIDQLNGRFVNLKVRFCPPGAAGC